MNTLWERLPRWNKDLDRRGPLWQWAVLHAFTASLAMAVLWAIDFHADPPGGLRWWWAFGVGFIIFYTSIRTLARYLRIRRRRQRA